MRKIIITTFFSLLFTLLYSQEVINKVDSLGYKHGVWMEYKVIPLSTIEENSAFTSPYDTAKFYIVNEYDFGNDCFIIRCLGEYKQGRKDGVWYEYYPNMQLKSQIKYENGLPKGECIRFWMSGKIRTKCYINKCEKILTTFYDENGIFLVKKDILRRELISLIYLE